MRKKGKAAKAENHERWLITYADLLTLLFAFFVVLYAGAQVDSEKYAALSAGLRVAFNNLASEDGGGSSPVFQGSGTADSGGLSQQLADFDSLVRALQEIARDRGLGDRIAIRAEQDRIVIDVTGDLLFSSGSAQIRPSAAPVLDAIAETLRARPNQIRVEGHTDNVPTNSPEFNSNWELSAARATAVLRRLVEEGRLPAERISAVAYADTRPKADNATAQGRAANRRAEIVVLYPPTGSPQSANPTPATTPAHSR